MPIIDLAVVRVVPDCLARWQRQTDGVVRQLADGSIQPGPGIAFANVFDDGRLSVSCTVAPGYDIFLTAEPHEWSRADQAAQ